MITRNQRELMLNWSTSIFLFFTRYLLVKKIPFQGENMKIILNFRLVLILLLSLVSQLVFADKYVPEHLCFKPERPLFMASSYHQEIYQQDIKQYKFCIREFITDQERAIIIHKESIKKATGHWNEFVEEDS